MLPAVVVAAMATTVAGAAVSATALSFELEDCCKNSRNRLVPFKWLVSSMSQIQERAHELWVLFPQFPFQMVGFLFFGNTQLYLPECSFFVRPGWPGAAAAEVGPK